MMIPMTNHPLYPNPCSFRLIEEVNGDKVVNHFTVEERCGEFYYDYNGEEYGPYEYLDDAVKAASQFILPGDITEWEDE